MMQKLSAEQRTQWAVDGYLCIEGALNPEEIEFFSNEIDNFRSLPGWEPISGMLPRGHYGWVDKCADQNTEAFMDRRDILSYNQAFIELIDRKEVFDLIVDIMGPNIIFSMSQAIVRASGDGFPGYTHTDGGEGQREIRVMETSRPIAVKAMYLLSDVEGRDCGNFTVFPGSHMRPIQFNQDPPVGPNTPGAVQLTGKAGDCYIFSHALWHGPAANNSGKARKTLLYNYCQMFMRCYDFKDIPEVVKHASPRQRRLLGDLGYDFRPGSYFYVPDDQTEIIMGAV
ncbi:MAG: hypothetical protein CMM43_06750 [Rhodospirillaceae bacterium]|nr:hypothetical protein [Rhodospirillaceae bacterium]|tara:strand:+ start:7068 stop:7919 length:852 start_codon:yes stop_codon:yes gene_type:complete